MRPTRRKTRALFALVLAALLLPGSTAWAQRVIEFEEMVFEGRLQKPEAFYILQNASLEFEFLTPKPSFLQNLLETAQEDVIKNP